MIKTKKIKLIYIVNGIVVTINHQILKTKSLKLAKKLRCNDFKASYCYLSREQAKENIKSTNKVKRAVPTTKENTSDFYEN